ncbi:DUF5617 domain-containing protein [Legionella cardiaca]|uniref:DUF5617 domain-containing protein n=1 Tax=Legionella cardiaca TaxID=1071983 RepID=A0ABY8AMX5_9GAMM|nr:DUF5617 domain-containing protein [Legionella cardiaca]WED42049.1 DUF5617 domain-containing protein [Legionella cardiaca]
MGLELFKFSGTKNTREKESSNIIMQPDGLGDHWIECSRKKTGVITKELLEEAFTMMEELERKNDDIIIVTQEMAEKINLLPKRFTSIVFWYRLFEYPASISKPAEQSKADCIKYLKHLPDCVTKVNFNIHVKWKNPEDLIKTLPKHVTHFTINADIIENCTYAELIPFFSSFSENIKEISLLGHDNKKLAIDNKVLRDLIIKLPLSVKTLTVPRDDLSVCNLATERKINLDVYRKKEYFPESYSKLTHSSKDIFQKAKNLLNDYTKNSSWSPGFTLFASFHWNRHHVDKVNKILKESTHIEDLLARLKDIETQKDFNPTGSLARRIYYIKNMQHLSQELSNEVEEPSYSELKI